MRIGALISSWLLGVWLISAAQADIVIYEVPGLRGLAVRLQGSTRVNPGRTVSFRHGLGNLTFDLADTKIIKSPTTAALAKRRLNSALGSRDPEQILAAGRWALHNGLLPQFYEAAAAAYQVAPSHQRVRRLVELKRAIDRPTGSYEREEAELRGLIPKANMKVAASNHFILLHDTPDTPTGRRRKPRAQERLELLETVYESFLLKFYSQGIELEVPRERLKVVLFNEHTDFLFYSRKLNPDVASAAGFFHIKKNVALFYDQGTDAGFRSLQQLSDALQAKKTEARKTVTDKTRDVVRMADTISLLVDVKRENLDIEVVSHEATHQMAANTGLLPRHVMIPTWVHEGLATYFETPGDAAWSGIGAVNRQQLEWYRALEPDRRISNIDFIVGNQIFDTAATHGSTLHAYAQAWALTHFLMERHFTRFMTFYRRMGEMPPDLIISPQVLTKLFNEVFDEDRRALDLEWRAYMKSLKTDIERILDEQDT